MRLGTAYRNMMVLLVIVAFFSFWGCSRSVTVGGVPVDDPVVRNAVQALFTIQMGAVGAMETISDGVEAGLIPMSVGDEALSVFDELTVAVLEARAAIVDYMTGRNDASVIEAAMGTARHVLMNLLEMTKAKGNA
jgi:hypothetical protein